MTTKVRFKKLDSLREDIKKILVKRTSSATKARMISEAYQKVEALSVLPEELCLYALKSFDGSFDSFIKEMFSAISVGVVKGASLKNFSDALTNLGYLRHGKDQSIEHALTLEEKELALSLTDKIKNLVH